ncbi:MAG TPA: sugar phosphate isomerase/epimerase [Devosia sp.]|jgi:sugar phosphate isomerase/epimerase|uniref:sugar phosphate isomerase/epimerase family protein n=1 Tax=Devosia sp. TaxID=1871048 RepID=UPI002DDD281F|nr:sugar phosphate isomerase/epimerase [Devosia sp.]HEV2517423.1 sugar phosphate isomerase/epimerase [Devosia sp.]
MAIRLGGHGLPIDSDDPFAFARAHREYGYGAAYVPEVRLDDRDRLVAIEQAFAVENVVLAEIGIWRNLVSPDEAVRETNLAYAVERLAIAEAVGAGCAVSYIGSFRAGTDYAPAAENMGPEAFDACVDTVRYLLDTVKPTRAKFALEMMQYSLPDSVDSYVELIRAIDRKMFGAHFDPVNIIMTPRVYFDNGALIRECFSKLGQWVVSCHAKDIKLHHQAALHFDEVQIGAGVLDYRTYLSELNRLPREVPLMLEHLKGEEYAVARDRIFAVGDVIGVDFAVRP